MIRNLLLALRTLAYMTGFMLLWLWLAPLWIGLQTSWTMAEASPARWLGGVPLIAGVAIVFSCFRDFILRGRGTPAPFDAPRRLVISGPYRYTRNPMYLGAGLFLIGCAILFSEFSTKLVWYAGALIIGVNLFIFFYEEPTLRAKFGDDYMRYCSAVPRWMLRFRSH
jgi:protein-S-isoprenylcysteine O-methyltransferase Ste14